MRNTVVIALISLLIAGCSKDKFTSTPQLKFKSFNTKELHLGDVLQISYTFTDLEGDLNDSIYVEQVSRNCPATKFKQFYKMPEFPVVRNSQGDILLTYGYRAGNLPSLKEPQCTDTLIDICYFRVMIQDKARHKSDTVATDDIKIYKQ